MLPLIPAVLLAILHGPAGVERLALEGRLPLALRALASRHVELQCEQSLERASNTVSEYSSVAAASRRLPSVWIQLLPLFDMAPQPDGLESALISAAPNLRAHSPLEFGKPREALFDCRRTRDGPSYR